MPPVPLGHYLRPSERHPPEEAPEILECPLYAQQRRAVGTAMRGHIGAIAREHEYTLTQEEALQWVIDNESPGWVLDSESTASSLGALREAVLDMHREVREVRYSASKAAPADRRAKRL